MLHKPEQQSMDEIFHKHLPSTLYLSHYDLAEQYGHTPNDWRKYLRDNHLFIETELAAIAEAEARSALSRLGNASGTEVSALKALLENSKLINDSQRQNEKVVILFVPPSDGTAPELKEEKRIDKREYDPQDLSRFSRFTRS